MQPIVEKYLSGQKYAHDIKNEIYYYYVMEYAGLLSNDEGFAAVSSAEYNSRLFYWPGTAKIKNGIHYRKKRLPYDVSDEEFAAIEATIPQDELDTIKRKSTGQYFEDIATSKSGAAVFFTIIAFILFIGGLIVASNSAYVTVEKGYRYTYTVREFSNTLFWSTYVIYFISGCFSLCAAEMFKKLQAIVNLLNRKL